MGQRQQADMTAGVGEKRFRALIEHALDFVVVLDAKGVIEYVSPSVRRITQYEPDELIGKTFLQFVHPDDAPRAVEDFADLLRNKALVRATFRYRAKDGAWLNIETLSRNYLDVPEVRGIVVNTRDVTEREQAKHALMHSESRYRRLFEAARDGVLILDAETGQIKDVNPYLLDLLGYPGVELIGKRFWEISPLKDAAANKAEYAKLQKKGYLRYDDMQLETRGGKIVHVECVSNVFDDYGTKFIQCNVRDISKRKRTIDALLRSESSLKEAQRIAHIGNWGLDLISRGLTWSEEIYRIFEIDPKNFAASYEAFLELIHPDDREYVDKAYTESVRNRTPYDHVHRLLMKDGRVKYVHGRCETLYDGNGSPIRSLGTVQDITARKEAEEQFRLASEALAATADGVMITDSAQRIVAVNKAFTRITGYSAEEAIGETPALLHSGRHDPSFYWNLWAELDRVGHWQGEIWDRRKNGEAYPELLTISAVKSTVGETTHYVGVFNDISQFKEYEARLEHLAHYDTLTGLPNRPLLRDRIRVAIAQAARGKGRLAILFVDLDRFKLINDSLGHEIGDKLLQAVAARLMDTLRGADTVCRLGGDEFLVLLPSIDNVEVAGRVAEKMVSELSLPYQIEEHELILTASIGIAVFPENGGDLDVLLRNADAAMYAAKEGGRNRYQFYSESMNTQSAERLNLERELRHALERGELMAVYQPQLELATGKVIGIEALIRWRHPRLGLLPPTQFIPIAEDSGQIVPIGEWMLREACRQNREWQRKGILSVPVSVNVSAIQFRQGYFTALVRQILQDTGLPPHDLELEVTESVVMHGADSVATTLHELNNLGVKLSIDDFGTGYSSLSYLRQFPLDRIKIDKSFVQDLPENLDSAAITQAIIGLGRSLGLRVVAEGVEKSDQAEYLQSITCKDVQGYFYCKPLPPAEFEEWLARWSRTSKPGDHNGVEDFPAS